MGIHRSQRAQLRLGSTLVEALAALGILALLGVALVPLLATQAEESRAGRTQNDARAVALAFVRYHSDTGRWPCNWSMSAHVDEPLVDYGCLYTNTVRLSGWSGPYLQKGVEHETGMVVARLHELGHTEGLCDAWGNAFQVIFRSPNAEHPTEASGVIVLISPGRDHEIDTSLPAAVAEDPADDDLVTVVTRKVD
jgi:type II secretory pathway pseudopilin PulG